MREIMTPPQVAEYLQLTPETVYRYIREGKLVASRLGRQYRVPKASDANHVIRKRQAALVRF
jgi:excisionase family DNA binding protein